MAAKHLDATILDNFRDICGCFKGRLNNQWKPETVVHKVFYNTARYGSSIKLLTMGDNVVVWGNIETLFWHNNVPVINILQRESFYI